MLPPLFFFKAQWSNSLQEILQGLICFYSLFESLQQFQKDSKLYPERKILFDILPTRLLQLKRTEVRMPVEKLRGSEHSMLPWMQWISLRKLPNLILQLLSFSP